MQEEREELHAPQRLSEAEISTHTPMMQQGANQLLRGL
jgi:hypothetical protein